MRIWMVAAVIALGAFVSAPAEAGPVGATVRAVAAAGKVAGQQAAKAPAKVGSWVARGARALW